MSLALYRKYRPGTFAEVKGQEHVTGPLQQALRNGRVHHAYLFSGPRGCGKTSSARILARSLNCERGPTPRPCGECESCVALAPTGPGSIDVIEIDAASHGGVDDARELRERAFFSPVAARFKVYIIDEAHMVTREGFNALLKLVEEPPPHLKFIFATTEPEKVIGTIRSRTHHYPFRLMPPGVLRGMLEEICAEEGIAVDPMALPLVVRSAGGSARDALSVLDQLLAGASEGRVTYAQAVALLGYTDASLLDEVVDAFADRDGAAVLDAVNRVIEGGHDPRRFAADLLERFRDLVILSHVPDAGAKGLLDYPADQLERMRGQADRMGRAELSRAAEAFHAGLTEMRGATSPRLLLELICARVLLPGAARDELALLTRIERLERRLAIGGTPASGDSAAERTAGGAAGEPAGGGAAAPTGEPGRDRATSGPAPESTPTRGVPPDTQPPPTQGGAAPNTSSRDRAARSGGHREPVDNGPHAEAVDNTPASGARRVEPGSAPMGPEPGAAPAGRGAPPPAPASPVPTEKGGLDTAAVRRMWPDVLEAVKHRRRFAWMALLGDVHVAAVDAASLTLAFAKDGDMKGFMSSGCDRVLQDALREVLGVEWVIRAIAGGSSQRPSGSAPPGTEPPAPRSHAPQRPAQEPSGPPAGASGPGPTGAAWPGPAPSESSPPGTPPPDSASPATGTSEGSAAPGGAGDPAAAPYAPPGPPTSYTPPPPLREAPPSPPPGATHQGFAPGDELVDDSFDVDPGLSGMALIQRELGGQIIREIDNS